MYYIATLSDTPVTTAGVIAPNKKCGMEKKICRANRQLAREDPNIEVPG